MEHAARVRAAVRRNREVDVSVEKDVIDEFFVDVESATEEEASECLGTISYIVSHRANPWKFHYSIIRNERGITMDWYLHDDGERLVDGKITGPTLVEVAYRAGVTFGIFSYAGLDIDHL